MSRKDYELIAAALRACRHEAESEAAAMRSDYIAATLAKALKEDNHRFDAGRFLMACGS